MSTAIVIDTSKVTGRRQLHFDSLDDIQADVELLATAREIHALGNWSPGQVFLHLSIIMNHCIDGFNNRLPWIVRVLFQLFMKRKVLTKPMGAGFKLPAKAAAELIPGPTSLEVGLASIRKGLDRLKTESKRVPSPFLGSMTHDDWTRRLHCRHCELHLSFLVPID